MQGPGLSMVRSFIYKRERGPLNTVCITSAFEVRKLGEAPENAADSEYFENINSSSRMLPVINAKSAGCIQKLLVL